MAGVGHGMYPAILFMILRYIRFMTYSNGAKDKSLHVAAEKEVQGAYNYRGFHTTEF